MIIHPNRLLQWVLNSFIIESLYHFDIQVRILYNAVIKANKPMKAIKVLLGVIVVILSLSCNKKNGVKPDMSVLNGDFEDWTDGRLFSWSTNSCVYCTQQIETDIVQQDINAYHGKYAAKFLYNNVQPAWAENEFYISKHPVNLTAYVKLAIYGTDTVSIKIRIYKSTAKVDSGLWLGTSSISKYTKIVIPVTQSSMQADSARITITGGHVKGPLNTNTVFWVDYLTLH